MTRFLAWLSRVAPAGRVDEFEAATRLEALRRQAPELIDLSFDSISAAGPNAALPHYTPDAASARTLKSGNLYLIDSGGQYPAATTDITRTIAIGEPTEEMKVRFTQALKGHVALATAVFPPGTTGGQLDVLARQFLWRDGVDYATGTGHGVGAGLAVHEGPQRIHCRGDVSTPLRAGMILSNEPGYYEPNAFGLRIENLLLVVEQANAGDEPPWLTFETLTFVPIDSRLIVVEMLSREEQGWLERYHATVLEHLGPHLDGDDRAWLSTACEPLASRSAMDTLKQGPVRSNDLS